MHEGLQLLADQLAADLGRSVLIEDSSLRLLAASALLGVVDQSRKDSILMRRPADDVKRLHRRYRIATAREPVLLKADEQLHTLARWCIPLRTDVLHGYIWLIDEPRMTSEQLKRATTAATLALELLTLHRQERAHTSRLLNDLLNSETQTRRSAASRLLELGALSDEPPFTLVAVHNGHAPHRGVGELESLGKRLEQAIRPASVVTAVVDEQLVAVLTATATSCGSAADVVVTAARTATEDVAVGTGASVPTLTELGDQLDNARYAALVAASGPEFSGAADWERLAGYALFQHVEHTRASVERLCPGVLRLLEPGNSMYRDTVETYLATCGDAHDTAQRLHIHRTTLYWRLNRAEQLLDRPLADATVRFDLQLALRLTRLLDAK